mmetsp:Transcript_21894/g.35248  ORF Transcript_21894/g.35248 Transcript_21894/m.35248 type:complete len:169 (-) Transcript_21894:1236-1742(-)
MKGSAKDVFYSTTNNVYGWRSQPGFDSANELRKVKDKERSFEKQQFLKNFWKSTNEAYGEFGFHKNTLCNAVEDLHEVARAKHVIRDRNGPVVPNESTHEIHLKVDNYNHSPKKEHKIYTTSNNEIGAKRPHFGQTLHPHSNSFTKTFLAGMQSDCGLNTTQTKKPII